VKILLPTVLMNNTVLKIAVCMVGHPHCRQHDSTDGVQQLTYQLFMVLFSGGSKHELVSRMALAGFFHEPSLAPKLTTCATKGCVSEGRHLYLAIMIVCSVYCSKVVPSSCLHPLLGADEMVEFKRSN